MSRTEKKRNDKWQREKEYRRLKEKCDELWHRSRKREVRELMEPYMKGYILEFYLKEKFRYEEKYKDLNILLDIQHCVTCRDKSFKTKNWKGEVIDLKPSFNSYSPYGFEKLDERIKKYFYLTSRLNTYDKKYYPFYELKDSVLEYFRYKRSKNIITHAYVVDGELESEESFVEYQRDKINYHKYYSSYRYKGFDKRSRRLRNRLYSIAVQRGELYGKEFDELYYNGKRYNTY